MQNQNDDDSDFNDDVYDDVLDENFEDDLGDDEYLDVDLDSEEEEGFYSEFDEDNPDGEEDWELGEEDADDGGDYIEPGAGAAVKKRGMNFDMSFNSMAIMGAVVVGVGVLIFQVVTKKPMASLDTFISALHMSGATDGPVFGEDNNELKVDEEITIENSEKEQTKGFLYDPEILDSMEMPVVEAPPMPTTISSEDNAEKTPAVVDDAMTPMPEEEKVAESASEDRIPRGPNDSGTTNSGLNELIDNPPPAQKEQSVAVEKQETKAEDFLKNVVKTREEKKQDVQPEQVAQEPPQEKVVVQKNSVPSLKQELSTEKMNTAADTSALEQKLSAILDRLDEMDLQITQIREAGNSKIEDISGDLDSLKKEMGEIASNKISAPAEQPAKKVTNTASAPKKSTPAPKKVSKPKAPSWELRAAQPGKAWVSKKGQKDMQPVVVGDSLNGIGRVTAISYDGRRWVVQGTSGRILQ